MNFPSPKPVWRDCRHSVVLQPSLLETQVLMSTDVARRKRSESTFSILRTEEKMSYAKRAEVPAASIAT